MEGLHAEDWSEGVDEIGPPCAEQTKYKMECTVVASSDEGEDGARRKKCKRSRRRDREGEISGVEEGEERAEDLKVSKKRKKDQQKENDSVSVNGLRDVTAVSQSSPRKKKKKARSDDSISEEEEEIQENYTISDSEVPPEGVGSVPGNEELESGNGIKRKKKRKTQEAVSNAAAPSSRNLREEAAEYLQLWRDDRAAWGFRKKTQYWLLQNMLDKKQVSKRDFKILLCYLEGLKGKQRQVCVDKAHKILEEFEGGAEQGIPRRQYKRAVAVLRTLA